MLDTKVDVLDKKVDVLDKKMGVLDARSAGTQQWIERIATHLGLEGAPRPRRGGAKRRRAS